MTNNTSITIYWISYTDPGDYNRISRFTKKINRLKKTLDNNFVIVKVPNLNKTEAHLKTLNLAIKNKEKQIIIIEDKTSIPDINLFKITTKTPIEFNGTILHLGGYMEEKITDTSNPNLIFGKSKSTFAYLINLENLKNLNSNNLLQTENIHSFIYKNSTAMYNPMLVVPYGYDINNSNNLMNNTLKGLSIIQFEEYFDSNDSNSIQSQLSLKFDDLNISDKELPRITLLTIIDDQRFWWPLLRLNLENIQYPTQKMKWIIIETTDQKGYDIEDLIPPPNKRGNPGKWQLEYIKKPEWHGIDITTLLTNHKNEIDTVGDYIIEFEPQSFYTTFSILSRVKTMIKYPNIDVAGTVSTQIYYIKNDVNYIIGDDTNLELIKGGRIYRNQLLPVNKQLNKIRIPNQFVSYQIDYEYKKDNDNTKPFTNNKDKFPDFLEKEDYMADLISIFEEMRKKKK